MNLNAGTLQPIEVQHILNWVVNLSRLEFSGVVNLSAGTLVGSSDYEVLNLNAAQHLLLRHVM